MTEVTARKVEQALRLPTYWLDQERDDYGHTRATPAVEKSPPPVTMIDPDHFTDCAYIVTDVCATASVKLSKEKFTTIVGMMLKSNDQSENGLKATAEALVKLSM